MAFCTFTTSDSLIIFFKESSAKDKRCLFVLITLKGYRPAWLAPRPKTVSGGREARGRTWPGRAGSDVQTGAKCDKLPPWQGFRLVERMSREHTHKLCHGTLLIPRRPPEHRATVDTKGRAGMPPQRKLGFCWVVILFGTFLSLLRSASGKGIGWVEVIRSL